MPQLRNTAFSAIDELFQGCLTTVHFQRYQECLTSHARFLRSLILFQLQQSLLVLLSLSMLPFCVISHVPGNSNVSILCDYQRLIFVPLISTFYHRGRRATLRSRGTLVTDYMGGGGKNSLRFLKYWKEGHVSHLPHPTPRFLYQCFLHISQCTRRATLSWCFPCSLWASLLITSTDNMSYSFSRVPTQSTQWYL